MLKYLDEKVTEGPTSSKTPFLKTKAIVVSSEEELNTSVKVTAIRDVETLALNPKAVTSAVTRTTSYAREQQGWWRRNKETRGNKKFKNFDDANLNRLTERAALAEALRCLKCADAPCSKSCPTQIDVKMFIQCIATKNYYGAARVILSNNAVGLSCGIVCPTSDLCKGSCNLSASEEGPINIGGLQHFAVEQFQAMGIRQIPDPFLKDPKHPVYMSKIAVIGSGPASVSCANFLARMGYQKIVVFEKLPYPGGLSFTEIPQFRLPYEAVRFEITLTEGMGVQFRCNSEFGVDVTLDSLRKEEFEAVFLGVGLGAAKKIDIFRPYGPKNNVWTSKDFLPRVAMSSKICGCGSELPNLGSHVVILGCGDTAFDCATSAFRCGAQRVTVVFRRSWREMRALPEERELAMRELVDFIPAAVPKALELDETTGKIKAVTLVRYEEQEEGGYKHDYEATYALKCSAVITAFGIEADETVLKELSGVVKMVENANEIDASCKTKEPQEIKSDSPRVFYGGDFGGGQKTVEAANDGKVAALSMHKYLQKLKKGPVHQDTNITLPLFYTPVDLVDLSITMCGVRFPNPFGLASAPCSTSGHMIRRAFETGWGFAVTKTFTIDKHLVTNVSPRIVRGTYDNTYGPGQRGFLNIELITEKTASYWIKTIKELKADFPDRVIVASVMAPFVQDEWTEVVGMAVGAGADIIELNLSCPHGMGECGMGLAVGQDAKYVKEITGWAVTAAKGVPVFPKLTPNITDIASIALAAQSSGAAGVTAINTVSGLMNTDGQGRPWPRIGDGTVTTVGGVSGEVNRPLGLAAVSRIRKMAPNLPIMGTGGVSSADSAAMYLRMGASVLQICSAIQNQDFSVVQDYISGLQLMLYEMGRQRLVGWDGQSPPAPYSERAVDQLPKFGQFKDKRETARIQELNAVEGHVLTEGPKGTPINTKIAVYDKPVQAAKLQDLVGKTADNYVKMHGDLSREEQVVAFVHPELCINCGKCYMTCNDNAYQAIEFNKETHIAEIQEAKCTGCGLCEAVCPIPKCIEFVRRAADNPLIVDRGVRIIPQVAN